MYTLDFTYSDYLSQDDLGSKKNFSEYRRANPFRDRNSDIWGYAGPKNFILRTQKIFFARQKLMPNDDDMLGSEHILPFQDREIGL